MYHPPRSWSSRVKSAGEAVAVSRLSEGERGFKSRKGKIEFRFLKWGDQTELGREGGGAKGDRIVVR